MTKESWAVGLSKPKALFILRRMPVASQLYELRDNDLMLGDDTRYVLKVRDLPLAEKPREKLMTLGPKNLDVAELVAILLGVGTTKEEVMTMARRIVQEYGEKALLHETQPAQAERRAGHSARQGLPGLSPASSWAGGFTKSAAGRAVYVHTAAQAYEYLKDIGASRKEQLRGLYLSSRYEVIHDEVISVGSLTANIVHPARGFPPGH